MPAVQDSHCNSVGGYKGVAMHILYFIVCYYVVAKNKIK